MKVKWGIIGCGVIVNKRSGEAIKSAENSEIVALMDKDINRVNDTASKLNVSKCYDNLDKFLDDKEIDAVYIATPGNTHCELTIAAAKKGKHVLCEKPMALNYAQCRKMIDVCKENNVKLGVAYYRRCFPKSKKIKQLITENKIGKIVFAHIVYSSTMKAYLENIDKWIAKAEFGGGLLLNEGCHLLDLLSYFMGEPTKVCGFSDRLTFDTGAADSVQILLQYNKTAHASICFNTNIAYPKTYTETIFGTEGTISGPVLSPRSEITVETKNGIEAVKFESLSNHHLPIVQDFVDSIIDNRTPFVSGEEGAKTSKIMDAVLESSKTGKVIHI
ncbi:MAG: Gfo/Idh/MocA family oxidoreductase [bacterium]|nr:Gfo/Idh/MocA family oxidoreductase [bacterium]